jgi:hypothetical protein
MAFVDLNAGDRVAMTFVRQRIELAIAAIFAGAVDEFESLDFPRRHRDLLRLEFREHSIRSAICPRWVVYLQC